VSLKLATGKFKGKNLASSDTAKELRPTQAKVREAIINVLNSWYLSQDQEPFSQIRVLDLYSGTGSMGFELLSNGVSSVSFVDYDPKCLRLLEDNAQMLKIADQVNIYRGKLPAILQRFGKERIFDLFFCDPPFKFSLDQYLANVEQVLKLKLLKTGAILVLEYKDLALEKALVERFSEQLKLIKTKEYGDCIVIFACHK